MSFLTLYFNPDDITRVLQSMDTELMYLIAALAVAVVVTVGLIFVKALNKPLKSLIRGTTWIAFGLVVIMVINMILSGPMYSIVNMVMTSMERASAPTEPTGETSEGEGEGEEEAPASSLTADVIDKATVLCEDLGEEGMILLKNDGILPLDKGTKLNTFGWSATNPVYGGTGSGALSDQYPIVSFLQGLTNAGLEYNTALTDFYTNFRAERPFMFMFLTDWTIPEPTQAEYDAAGIFEGAKNYSDTAIFFVARNGGEAADLPRSYDGPYDPDGSSGGTGMSEYADDLDPNKHYLELSNRERATLERLNEQFENIIVIVNAANAMELGFIDEYEHIRAAVLVPGGPGQSAFNSLGRLLVGDANFSGKTVNIFLSDLTKAPSYNNFGVTYYTNMTDIVPEDRTQPSYVAYVEGIYVGYKFWETASDVGLINYEESVEYPFGYGLSYTTFKQELVSVTEAGGTITATVKVTNTGSVAGKEIVQMYYNPPYTNGGVEKSTANLVAFAKTSELAPNAEETVTLTWKVEDMASYDTTANNGAGAWVVEAGDYIISLNSDSHNIIAEHTYTVNETIVDRESDVTKSTNQFAFAENRGQITYLSRKDNFANYEAATAKCAFTEMTAEQKAGFWTNFNYDPTQFNNPDDVMPTTGAKNNLLLQDMRGIEYDNVLWDKFLDQLTVEDMVNLISKGGYQSTEIRSIGKTQQIDCDGPASINNNFTGEGSIGFTSAVMIASSWNEELAYRFGDSIGQMADMMDVSGWYAPAMNTHRTAFSGRNFEYYSEDGFIAGKMAAAAVRGAEEHGVYSFIKHFALNDQEENRGDGLCTWSTEQAIRELYLKPFELAVKEGGADAVMSGYNHVGNEWAGACSELLNNVLRDEWGFVGMVLTDYFSGGTYMDADIAIRNGNDFCLSPNGGGVSELDDRTSATSILAARQACKNILYVTANCRDYEGLVDLSTPTWQVAVWAVSAVLALALVGVEVLIVKKYLKASKAAA